VGGYSVVADEPTLGDALGIPEEGPGPYPGPPASWEDAPVELLERRWPETLVLRRVVRAMTDASAVEREIGLCIDNLNDLRREWLEVSDSLQLEIDALKLRLAELRAAEGTR